jgi:uncharacterized protein YggU (UPF0235/DUF167 family)
VDGAANEAVIGLLSRLLDVPPSCIDLVQGARSSHKRFRVKGLSIDEARTLLEIAAAKGG